ncbi:MAG TPA: hypothetical protein EYP58_00960 [bacterium (Candidatus Stahlbacteria)]|nr:hypothetical protein [Candidatus Stahlbacteria bacterium]
MMYFPSGRFLKVAICGFDILVANLVWLRAIQYYGQHVLTDYQYEWLPHIFNILTKLDPLFINGYRFGGVIISEDAQNPKEAKVLLKRGIVHNPLRWELPFDIGFICYTIDKDYHNAAKYFKLAALREGPQGRAIRFAAHSFRKAKEWRRAKDLWREVMKNATHERKIELAQRSICYIRVDEEIEDLMKVITKFQIREKRRPEDLGELVEKGYIREIPDEPFGGRYLLGEGGVATSTTLLLDELEFIVRFLNHRISAYRTAKAKFPEKLEDLIKEKFIPKIPRHPFGKQYFYDANQGKVIISYKRRQ